MILVLSTDSERQPREEYRLTEAGEGCYLY